MRGIVMSRLKKIRIILLLFFIIFIEEVFTEDSQIIQINRDIRLKAITENIWLHISDINMPEWGRISANGMAVITDTQLVVIDTPWNDIQTQLLIEWFKENYDISDIKIIVTHYHDDNLGGLNWIHQNGIESYSIGKTQEICEKKGLPIPKKTLSNVYIFDFLETALEVYFPGEGHTVDNIIVYFPKEKILFGGCSVKALNSSGLGNTADANLNEWPVTLLKMKRSFPEVQLVVPGHGMEGTISLIDHTLSLFGERLP